MKKIDKEEFCNRSNLLHNNKYDYSLVEYKNNRTKVSIICNLHGLFNQVPESHMKGFGCKKCSGNYNYTNKEYISKLVSIFGSRYNYDKINYKSQKEKVILFCNIHGDIEKFPQVLLRGSGCSKCETNNYKIDTYEFIERSKKIHKDLYNYNYVFYVNDTTPVKIECVKHGIFNQVPNAHLSGHGCIFCSGRYKYTNEEFIEKSILTHGKKYDYSLVNYINAQKKVKIICSKHGEFIQKPTNHILGNGCPSCKESKGELSIYEFLNSNNILHHRQKTFKGCKSKSLLFFDFFIPEKNLCIEYDGEFHYLPIFGEKNLEIMKIRDSIKTKFCIDNNIRLIRIPYTEFQNIENILSSELLIDKSSISILSL